MPKTYPAKAGLIHRQLKGLKFTRHGNYGFIKQVIEDNVNILPKGGGIKIA